MNADKPLGFDPRTCGYAEGFSGKPADPPSGFEDRYYEGYDAGRRAARKIKPEQQPGLDL